MVLLFLSINQPRNSRILTRAFRRMNIVERMNAQPNAGERAQKRTITKHIVAISCRAHARHVDLRVSSKSAQICLHVQNIKPVLLKWFAMRKNTVTIERTRWGLVPSMRAHRCHRLTARACAALPFPFSSSFTPSKWPIRYVNSTIFTPKRPEICETAVPDDAKTLVNTRCE